MLRGSDANCGIWKTGDDQGRQPLTLTQGEVTKLSYWPTASMTDRPCLVRHLDARWHYHRDVYVGAESCTSRNQITGT